ncbi:hypothetical protein CB1_078722005 [Camelus ferus]|nr:hypothetical protein CB1_078722005 [Camelus ferus]
MMVSFTDDAVVPSSLLAYVSNSGSSAWVLGSIFTVICDSCCSVTQVVKLRGTSLLQSSDQNVYLQRMLCGLTIKGFETSQSESDGQPRKKPEDPLPPPSGSENNSPGARAPFVLTFQPDGLALQKPGPSLKNGWRGPPDSILAAGEETARLRREARLRRATRVFGAQREKARGAERSFSDKVIQDREEKKGEEQRRGLWGGRETGFLWSEEQALCGILGRRNPGITGESMELRVQPLEKQHPSPERG